MTIIELKKMMIKAKKEDKIKANALMMLVDTAQKIAKEKNEDVNEKHIIEAAKKLSKMAKESIEAGIEEAKKELTVYEEFLPKMLNEEETKKLLQNIIDEIGSIVSPEGKELLKENLLLKINSALSEVKVKNIFYREFIVQ